MFGWYIAVVVMDLCGKLQFCVKQLIDGIIGRLVSAKID